MTYRCNVCGEHFETGSLKTGRLECSRGHSWNFRTDCSQDLSVRQKAQQATKEVSQYIFEAPHDYRGEARRLETDLDMRPVASGDIVVDTTNRSTIFAPRRTQTYGSDVLLADRLMPADTFNAASRT